MSEPALPDVVRRGRPRDARADAAILRAARELLEEMGYSGLTMDAVAVRAGVGKATVYRRWSNRAALAMEAFLAQAEQGSPFPDSGSAREDFRLHLRALARLAARTEFARVLAALVAETHEDPVLARALLERFVAVRRADAALVIERGVARGELRRDVDADIAIDGLYGPLYYRLLVSRARIDTAFTDALVGQVLDGLARRPDRGA
jgi:AcrR family transcriptional regulator